MHREKSEEIARATHNAHLAWEEWQTHEEQMLEARKTAERWEARALWLREH